MNKRTEELSESSEPMMVATVQNSSTAVPAPVLRADDSCSAMRMRCIALTSEAQNRKRVKLLCTATVPTKRCKLSKNTSSQRELLAVKTKKTPNLSSFVTQKVDAGDGGFQPCERSQTSPATESNLRVEPHSNRFAFDGTNLNAALVLPAGTMGSSVSTETGRDRTSDAGSCLADGDVTNLATSTPRVMLSRVLNTSNLDDLVEVDNPDVKADFFDNVRRIDRDSSRLSPPRNCASERPQPPTSAISSCALHGDRIQGGCVASRNNGTGSDVVPFENSANLSKQTLGRNGKFCNNIENMSAERTQRSMILKEDVTTDMAARELKKCKDGCDLKPKSPSVESADVSLKNISTSDIIKVLRQFNLTLKAFPVDSRFTETVASESVKLRTVAFNNESNFALTVLSKVGGKNDKAQLLDTESQILSSVKQAKFSLPACSGKTALRATPCGTFSTWKINRTRLAQSCGKKTIVCGCSKAKCTDSACRRETEASQKKGFRGNRNFGSHSKCNSNKSSLKHQRTLRFPSDLQMKTSLDKAFSDLEARDRAAQETLEASGQCSFEFFLNTISHKNTRTLSSTMGDRLSTDQVGIFGSTSDPLLTSAAYEDSNTCCGDLIYDLVSTETLSLHRTPERRYSCGLPSAEKNESKVLYSGESSKLASEGSNVEIGFRQKGERFPSADRPFSESRNESGVNGMRAKIDHPTWTEQSRELRRDISLQELHSSNCEYSRSNDCNVRASKSKSYSSTNGFARPERTNLALLTSSNCLTGGRATAYDTCLESTQAKTLESEDNLDSFKVEALEAKPLERWNSEEVAAWVSLILRRYEASKISSLVSDQEVERTGGVEHQNLSGTLFSRITDGRELLNLTLDKLIEYCSNRSLAVYLLEKLQELVEDNATNRKKMHRGGYCKVAESPTSPSASAYQLEKSVNLDELLEFDSILGSLELTEVLDFQSGSCFESFETVGENFAQHLEACPGTNAGLHGNVSPNPRPAMRHSTACDTKFDHWNSDKNLCSTLSDYQTYSREHLPLEQNPNISINAEPNANCELRDFVTKSEAIDLAWMPSTSTEATTPCRPVSPSTYYNLAIVGNALLQHVKEEDEEFGDSTSCDMSEPRVQSEWEKSRETVCSRKSSVSDNDSGIYSPESVHGKNTSKKGTECVLDLMMPRCSDRFPRYDGHLTPPHFGHEDSVWVEQSENHVPVQGVPLKNLEAAPTRSTVVWDREEAWERASTSSTASTLSAESDTKLFNMDDCQTYFAHRPTQALGYGRDGSLGPTNEDDAFFGQRFEKLPISDPSCITSNKQQQIVTQGNITTVYPTFVAHVRRSTSASQAPHCVPHVDMVTDSFQDNCPESVAVVDDLVATKSEEQHGDGKKLEESDREFVNDSDMNKYNHHALRIATYVDPDDMNMRRTQPGKSVHLWEFIRDILLNPEHCPRLIKWEDRKIGIFRFVQSDVVASMWGEKKNNPKMTYEKLSRAMRYYYNRGILERVHGRRLVYKFGKNAYGWRQCGQDEEIQSAKQNPMGGVDDKFAPEQITTPSLITTPSQLSLKRKLLQCTTSVPTSNDLVPCVKKHRRTSSEAMQNFDNRQKSAETQTLLTLRPKIEGVKKCIRVSGIKREPRDDFTAAVTPNTASFLRSKQAPCVVYIARQEPLGGKILNKEIQVGRKSVYRSDDSKCSPQPLADLQGKLPSANVLLGKQFRIAATAI